MTFSTLLPGIIGRACGLSKPGRRVPDRRMDTVAVESIGDHDAIPSRCLRDFPGPPVRRVTIAKIQDVYRAGRRFPYTLPIGLTQDERLIEREMVVVA